MIHKIKGTIIHGNNLGRKLGFPTANIAIADNLPVQDGVYIAEVNVEGNVWTAMVNVGVRPTVQGSAGRFAEAHLFDFSENIYGKEAIVFLLGYVRPEIRFDSIDELKSQLEKDKKTVTDYFISPSPEDEKRFNMHLNMKPHPHGGNSPHGGHPHGGNSPHGTNPHSAHPDTSNPHSIKKS